MAPAEVAGDPVTVAPALAEVVEVVEVVIVGVGADDRPARTARVEVVTVPVPLRDADRVAEPVAGVVS